jgi:phospholipase C
MRRPTDVLAPLAIALTLAGCSSSSAGLTVDAGPGDTGASDAPGDTGTSDAGGDAGPCAPGAGLGVGHVIVVVQENHTFDSYFGRWCTAAPGSNPTCTAGPSCCEAAPQKEPSGASPVVLDDATHAGFDPNHSMACELAEIDKGKMDGFVTGASCGTAGNWGIAPTALIQPYLDLAGQNAIADRYFQSIAGQSSANDMYFAVAKEVFLDNAFAPKATGSQCSITSATTSYAGQTTVADLLKSAGASVTWYAEGYGAMQAAGTGCPMAPAACAAALQAWPCTYDPGDIPFMYYPQHANDPTFMQDYHELGKALSAGSLPDVSFVKALGYKSEHPGWGVTISDGVTFVTDLVKAVNASCYKDDTLILVTWDEGGGFFDHVPPPPDSTVDNQPYGTRVPLLAIGRYASKGTVSHTTMEHSSIVKFLEWNYLAGKTGQLHARDAVVNNLGSLLDPAATRTKVPAQ